MAGHWVKVHRSMMDHAIWGDEWLVKLFIWCLYKANYRDAIYRGTVVKRGQFVTGRNTASDELMVSPSKWYRGINRLAELGCIEISANSDRTTITVCNYMTYQDESGKSEQPVNSQRTASDTTNEQQVNSQRTQEKEDKEDKEEEKIKNKKRADKPPVVFSIPENINNPQFIAAWERWKKHRSEIGKKITQTAGEEQLAKCSSMGTAGAIEAITHSIVSGWTGIFPPKANGEKTKQQSTEDMYPDLNAQADQFLKEFKERHGYEYGKRPPPPTNPPKQADGVNTDRT